MSSVTQRIAEVKQPYGGYIRPKQMRVSHPGNGDATPLDRNFENLNPTIVGMAVDYLTRLAMGASPEEAFKVSILGAISIDPFSSALTDARKLTPGLVNTHAIKTACRLVRYDVGFRAGAEFFNYDVDPPPPNSVTINNIATMVKRGVACLQEYGPVTLDGFTFDGGYTFLVDSGDGDFLTHDTLWDFKVSVKPPTSAHTLQLMVYWLMGLHSGKPEFKTIRYLGIFNPRLNCAYRIAVEDIPDDVIAAVARDVIGHGLTEEEYKRVQSANDEAFILRWFGLDHQDRPGKLSPKGVVRIFGNWDKLIGDRVNDLLCDPSPANGMAEVEQLGWKLITWVCGKHGHHLAQHFVDWHYRPMIPAVFQDTELLRMWWMCSQPFHPYAPYNRDPCPDCLRILESEEPSGEPCGVCLSRLFSERTNNAADINEWLRSFLMRTGSMPH